MKSKAQPFPRQDSRQAKDAQAARSRMEMWPTQHPRVTASPACTLALARPTPQRQARTLLAADYGDGLEVQGQGVELAGEVVFLCGEGVDVSHDVSPFGLNEVALVRFCCDPVGGGWVGRTAQWSQYCGEFGSEKNLFREECA